MRRRSRKAKSLLIALTTTAIALLFATPCHSQSAKSNWDKTGNLFLRLEGVGGSGLDWHVVGQTTEGDDVSISAGGGIGIQLVAGSNLLRYFRIEGSFGYESAGLDMELENGSGSFGRTHLGGSAYLRIPVGEKSTLNLGGGMAEKGSPDLDLDFSSSRIYGAAHNIYHYNTGQCTHWDVVWEYYPDRIMSISVGLRYEIVEYELESLTSNGVSYPLDMLDPEVRNEYELLDGSGVDLLLGFTYYFKRSSSRSE